MFFYEELWENGGLMGFIFFEDLLGNLPQRGVPKACLVGVGPI